MCAPAEVVNEKIRVGWYSWPASHAGQQSLDLAQEKSQLNTFRRMIGLREDLFPQGLEERTKAVQPNHACGKMGWLAGYDGEGDGSRAVGERRDHRIEAGRPRFKIGPHHQGFQRRIDGHEAGGKARRREVQFIELAEIGTFGARRCRRECGAGLIERRPQRRLSLRDELMARGGCDPRCFAGSHCGQQIG